jgi:uncharacterized protein YkwD
MFWALLSLSQSFYYAPPTPINQASNEETAFVEIINGFREGLHLQTVAGDDRLTEAAQNHAMWMSYYHVLTHVGPRPWWKSSTRMYAAGIPYGKLVGENIARGSYTAKDTFIQWFFSPEHLEGMMTPEYDHIGVSREGCASTTDESGCFWVTDFAALKEKQSFQDETHSRAEILEAAEAVIGPMNEADRSRFLNPILDQAGTATTGTDEFPKAAL